MVVPGSAAGSVTAKTQRPEQRDNVEEDQVASKKLGVHLLLISTLHRLLSLALLLLILPAISLAPAFDSSSLLLTTPPPRSLGLAPALERLVRWDAVHFLDIAQRGYGLEQQFAFQPGLPGLLSFLGRLGRQGREWNASQAVALTSAAAAVAASLSPWLLFHLLRRHIRSTTAPVLAALLSIFSPAPASLVTPSPEAFFSLFVLLGLLALAMAHGGQSMIFALQVLVAALAFALATTFRANGIMLSGFIAWHLLWEPASKRIPLALRLLLSPLVLVPAAPFFAFQHWAQTLFCHSQEGAGLSSVVRPWCGSWPWTGIYAFVQKEYWDVGLFRYWTMTQLPNFVLAAPVLALAIYGFAAYVSGAQERREVLKVLVHLRRGPSSSNSTSSHPATSSPPTPRNDPQRRITYTNSPALLPVLLHGLVTTALLLLVSHVQIALRFATPGGMVLVWIGAAGWVLRGDCADGDASGGAQGTAAAAGKDASRTSAILDGGGIGRGTSWRLQAMLGSLLMWNVLSLALYSGFYPPA